nr:hypothetical protein [Corallococcus exiguus]
MDAAIARIEQQEARIAELEARLRSTSRNSSKPRPRTRLGRRSRIWSRPGVSPEASPAP